MGAGGTDATGPYSPLAGVRAEAGDVASRSRMSLCLAELSARWSTL